MLNLDCPDDLSRYGGPWAIILITADCWAKNNHSWAGNRSQRGNQAVWKNARIWIMAFANAIEV